MCVASPAAAHTPVAIGVRIWSGQTQKRKQSFASSVVSIITLTLYCGWLHVLLALFVSSAFSRLALAVTIGLLSTVLLPAKPVLW